MTVLVTGASGQVGKALAQSAWPDTLTPRFADRAVLDIADPVAVEAAIGTDVKLVINAAAYTAVDRAESDSDAADAGNHLGPANLARACAARGIPLIHISTDYVFDGSQTSPYRETDPTGPTGVYGATKLAGEEAVRRLVPHHIILRTAWVFSDQPPNFLLTMLRLAGERDTLNVVDDQHGGPTAAQDIAAALITIAQAIGVDGFDGWGTYHFAGAPVTTWFGFAAAIFEEVKRSGRPAPRLNAIPTTDYPTPARRPPSSVLDCARIAQQFGIAQPDWKAAMSGIIDRRYQGGPA